jgi:hypothetical protein
VIRAFRPDRLPDLPAPGQCGLLPTAVVDLDLTTCATAGAQLLDAANEPVQAVVLDVGAAFVAISFVRALVALAERATHTGRATAVVGAPAWLIDLAPRLDMPAIHFADTVTAAALRIAATGDADKHKIVLARPMPDSSARPGTATAAPDDDLRRRTRHRQQPVTIGCRQHDRHDLGDRIEDQRDTPRATMLTRGGQDPHARRGEELDARAI